jgi:hypothetical protein
LFKPLYDLYLVNTLRPSEKIRAPIKQPLLIGCSRQSNATCAHAWFGGDRAPSRHHPASHKLLSSSVPLAARPMESWASHMRGQMGRSAALLPPILFPPASPPVSPPAQLLGTRKRTLKPWSPCPCSKHPEPQKILPWRLLLVVLPLG